MVGVNCQGPSLWDSGQGAKRRQGPTHPGLLSSGALLLREALRRTRRGCQVRLSEALPAPRPPLSPAPYPGTAVKAWHSGDALVSLLSFLQEGRWVGSLPLGTVPAEALRRERDRRCGVGVRPGWARRENSPLNSAGALSLGSPPPTLSFLPSHIPTVALLHPQGTQSQRWLRVSSRRKLWWGQAKATFQTGVWEEAEGPAEGPSVPAVPAPCTHGEDMPQGLGLKRPAPNTSFAAQGSKGSSCRSSQAFCRHPQGWSLPCSPADSDCHRLRVRVRVRWA